MILAATLSGLLIGFGSMAGLEPEVGEAVLFVVTMSAGFFGFSTFLRLR